MQQLSWIIGSEKKESNPPLPLPVKIIHVEMTRSSTDIVMWEIELWGEVRGRYLVCPLGEPFSIKTSPVWQCLEEDCKASSLSLLTADMFHIVTWNKWFAHVFINPSYLQLIKNIKHTCMCSTFKLFCFLHLNYLLLITTLLLLFAF